MNKNRIRNQRTIAHSAYFTVNKYLMVNIGMSEAVVLSVLMDSEDYFERNVRNFDGWFYHKNEQLMDKTGLSLHMVKKARDHIKNMDFIRVEKRGIPAKNYYCINHEAIDNFLTIPQESNETADWKTNTDCPTNLVEPHKTPESNEAADCRATRQPTVGRRGSRLYKGNREREPRKGTVTVSLGNETGTPIERIISPSGRTRTKPAPVEKHRTKPAPVEKPKTKPAQKKTLSDADKVTNIHRGFARRLHKAILQQPDYTLPKTAKPDKWAVHFYRLMERDGFDRELIDKCLCWYEDNIGNKYTPVIHSGEAFRRKFDNLQNALTRSSKYSKDRPSTNNGRVHLTSTEGNLRTSKYTKPVTLAELEAGVV